VRGGPPFDGADPDLSDCPDTAGLLAQRSVRLAIEDFEDVDGDDLRPARGISTRRAVDPASSASSGKSGFASFAQEEARRTDRCAEDPAVSASS
jgi:hypothetical protein